MKPRAADVPKNASCVSDFYHFPSHLVLYLYYQFSTTKYTRQRNGSIYAQRPEKSSNDLLKITKSVTNHRNSIINKILEVAIVWHETTASCDVLPSVGTFVCFLCRELPLYAEKHCSDASKHTRNRSIFAWTNRQNSIAERRKTQHLVGACLCNWKGQHINLSNVLNNGSL